MARATTRPAGPGKTERLAQLRRVKITRKGDEVLVTFGGDEQHARLFAEKTQADLEAWARHVERGPSG